MVISLLAELIDILHTVYFVVLEVVGIVIGTKLFLSSLDYIIIFSTVALVLGVNLIIWTVVGIVRVVADKVQPSITPAVSTGQVFEDISARDVAVVVPAHNEEMVINQTLESLFNLVPRSNLFVVSDGSKDKTAEIVSSFNIPVLSLANPRGKAGALEACIKHFSLLTRFKAVLFVDADTRLKSDYLDKALPFFRNPKVIAVAGYAQTIWNPNKLTWKQKLFILHRERIYFLSQRLVKFGQTWKHASVTHIVPGFASIYRASALANISMNPPGLVIEDFNMTFEIHHKNLGIVAHHPSVVAYTQDPDNLHDYFRQVKRWQLGFWQTVRLHGFWYSSFWVALAITIVEVVLGSLLFLCLPALLFFWYLPAVLLQFNFFMDWSWLIQVNNFTSSWPLLFWLLVGIILPDYLLTLIVAVIQRRPHYLLCGLAFPALRFIDGLAVIRTVPKAFLEHSSGHWISPTRRQS